LADYAERYIDFRRAGVEVVALCPESPRKARRLRTTLKLPFIVLSDAKLEVARKFGLIDRERPGLPTPATVMLDSQGQILLSSLNQGPRATKCLFARDMLDYARANEIDDRPAIRAREPEQPKPGWLFFRGFANLAIGLLTR
jgi:alkyl hydroperoxide reductase subunit AhpC